MMRYTYPTLFLGLTTLLAFGCTATEGYTKEQAQALHGETPEGDDICALEGWYDDGECDDFCLDNDPQCAVCLAFPTCGEGEMTHESEAECPADGACHEVSICGSSVWCSGGTTCLAAPTCGPGETAHENESDCPADASCTPTTICGQTIWCSGNAVNCLAFPSCGEGEMTHASQDACLTSCTDCSCYPATLCGSTIWCSAPGATCLAFPTCGEGEMAHSTEAECPADTRCYAASICGETIWCSSGVMCEGENPQGCQASGCDAGFHCDTSMGGAPSACACDSMGLWLCTSDENGGACVAD